MKPGIVPEALNGDSFQVAQRIGDFVVIERRFRDHEGREVSLHVNAVHEPAKMLN